MKVTVVDLSTYGLYSSDWNYYDCCFDFDCWAAGYGSPRQKKVSIEQIGGSGRAASVVCLAPVLACLFKRIKQVNNCYELHSPGVFR